MVVSMDRWKGKVAIVTGASAGIGAAIAEKLVEEGMQVVGLARREERVKELSKKLSGKPGKLYAVKADMTKEKHIIKAFKWATKHVGPVHVLVNNAGLVMDTNLTDGDAAKWKTVFDTNVLGLCIATREAARIMKANKIDGHIVHINSGAGHRVPNVPNFNVYPASKYAVTALTESLRQEFNHLGSKVKITSLSPGVVTTEITKNVAPAFVELLKDVPALTSEDIADSLVYVLSTPPHVQIHELTIFPVGQKL